MRGNDELGLRNTETKYHKETITDVMVKIMLSMHNQLPNSIQSVEAL